MLLLALYTCPVQSGVVVREGTDGVLGGGSKWWWCYWPSIPAQYTQRDEGVLGGTVIGAVSGPLHPER